MTPLPDAGLTAEERDLFNDKLAGVQDTLVDLSRDLEQAGFGISFNIPDRVGLLVASEHVICAWRAVEYAKANLASATQ